MSEPPRLIHGGRVFAGWLMTVVLIMLIVGPNPSPYQWIAAVSLGALVGIREGLRPG